jgi:hypothetical protein
MVQSHASCCTTKKQTRFFFFHLSLLLNLHAKSAVSMQGVLSARPKKLRARNLVSSIVTVAADVVVEAHVPKPSVFVRMIRQCSPAYSPGLDLVTPFITFPSLRCIAQLCSCLLRPLAKQGNYSTTSTPRTPRTTNNAGRKCQ